MAYGTVKVDNIVFDDGGSDQTVTVSGLYNSLTSGITVTGTISGAVVIGSTSVSGTTVAGVTVTGTTVQGASGTFTSLTGTTIQGTTATYTTGSFTSLTGTTTTGTTANFVSGVFTTSVSGTTVIAPTGTFTSLTGTTTQGTTATYTTGSFTSLTGTTTTGTTLSFTSGVFTTLSGATATFTSGIIASGTAAAPSLAILGDPDTGVFSPGANQLAVATNGTQRITIDASGRLLVDALAAISTANHIDAGASNVQNIHIRGSAFSAALAVSAFTGSSTANRAAGVVLSRSNGGDTTQTIVGNGHTLGSIVFNGSDGTAFKQAAGIRADVDGTPGTNDMPGRLVFSTTPSGSATPTERLRITSAGNVGIGTSAPSTLLHVKGASNLTTDLPFTIQNNADSLRLGIGAYGLSNTVGVSQGTDFYYNVGKDHLFQTDGTTKVAIKEDGKVGIGTTSPGNPLSVVGFANATNGWSVGNEDGNTSGYFVSAGSVSNSIEIAADPSNAGGNSVMQFSVDGTERARIDSSGRLLVGTSSALPAAGSTPAFQVVGDGAASWQSLIRTGATIGGSNLALGQTRGSVGSRTIAQDNDILSTINFVGDDGTDLNTAAAWIRGEVDGTPGADDMPGRLVFSTTADGAASPTERVRLTNTGALLVGTTVTPTGAGSGAVVAQDRVVISSAGAGRHQVIAGDPGAITATTGTVVFKFKSLDLGVARSAYVKLAIANRRNSAAPSDLPAAEYAFQLHHTAANNCSLNGATTVFEFTYVYATHVAFADLGSGECTVTLTNPTALLQTGSYKVEVLTHAGSWTLDSVTTT